MVHINVMHDCHDTVYFDVIRLLRLSGGLVGSTLR